MASPVAGAAAAAAARLLEDDRLSWEDSERFEEDSLSWLSDPESLCQNWRGWSVPGRPNEHTACSSSAVAATPVNAALPLLYTGGIAAQPCPSSPPPARPPPSSTAAAVGAARGARPTVTSLKDLTAKVIAQHKTFEEVEHFSYSQLHMATPEPLQLKIAYWCFPGADEDIRLYSCLANGNADEFHRGESLFKSNCVRRVLQIGFHLSANVCHSSLMWLRGADGSMRPSGEAGITADAAADCGGLMGPSARWHNVAVTVDRCKIISCMCSGCPNGYWCCHVVALCLYRIHNVNSVRFRPPVSESLNHLKDKQLRKFAQYLISELPRDILPTAQRILDELLSTGSNMNALDGAPDPTAGACRDETAAWALNEHTLNDNIRKILHKFCIPSPTVFSDVNYLSTQQPPIANEWQALLRPLRSREPEGLCNLLSIVREMFRRRDDNAAVLLHIITERCMHTMQVVLWWYQVSLSQSGQYPMCIGAAAGSGASAANAGGPSTSAAASGSAKSGLLSNFHSAQFSCAYLCDEIVDLWRLAAMSPRINQTRRAQLADHLKGYHGKVVEKVWNVLVSQVRNQGMNHANHHHHQAGSGVTNTLASVGHMAVPGYGRITAHTARFDLDAFPGFRPAVQSCRVNWPLETRRQLAVLYASDQPPLPLAVAVPEDALQDADGTRQHGQVVVGAKGGDMCRSPFSPNLPILRDKHVRTTLLNASSCETVVAVGLDGVAAASAAAPDAPLERDAAASPAGSRSSSPESGQGSSDASVPGNGRQQPAAVPPPAHQAPAAQRSPHQRDSGGDEEPNDGLEHLINMYLAQDEPGSAAQRQQQRRHSSPQPGAAAAAADLLPDSPVSTVDSLLAALPATSCDAAFTVCEALHAHGYGDEARALAERLAGRVLRDGPSPFCRFLDQPLPGNVPPDSRLVPAARCAAAAGGSGKRKKKQQQEPPTVPHPRALEASRVASTFYKRTLFLCSVLLQKRCEHWRHRVAFELALHALAAPRPPAATKYYEIECYHMEGEVVATLKRMHVHVEEMNMVRAAAKRLRALEVSSGAPLYVVPFSLAHYVFDTLCSSDKYQFLTKSGDEELGFAAAGAVLAMRTCASEATQALLCETMRRQRGDLAVALLLRFKDDHEKLAVIMDRLLDPELHRMYKQTGCNAAYYGHQAVAAHRRLVMQLVAQEMGHPAELHHTLSNMAIGDQCGAQLHADATTCGKVPVQSASTPRDEAAHADAPELSGAAAQAGRLLIERHSSDSRSTGSGGTAAGSTSSTGAGPQVTDAHAHYMSELAKRVLTEAGGNHSSAMFNAPAAAAGAAAAVDGNVPQAGVHRALHMCAFHIGLYALGLHNKVTQNWQSRTYSSQWSWLMNQAIEIGRPALRLLVDTWHEHMTPTEVAQLADKASQGYRAEPAMVAAAAELALCALHNAHALNQIDLNKALVQCKEQSTSMLERACCAVEQAAKDYGVYPDVLFVVARRWHDLFHELERHDATRRRNAPAHAAAYDVAPGVYRHNVQAAAAPAAYCAPPMAGYQQHVGPGQPQPHHAPPYQHQYGVLAAAGGNGGAPLQHVQSTVMTPPCANMFFGQQPAPASAVYMGAHPTSGRPLHVSQSAPALGPHHGFAAGSHQLRAAMYMQHAQQQQQQQHHHHQQQQHQHQQQLGMQSHMQPQQQQQQHMAGGGDERQMQHERLKYLLSAYRVGMLAMETMGKRIHDDRSYHKYSQNPPYGDDVRWLFGVSQKLGLVYAYQFCLVAAESVVSPFVLWDLALESTRLFPPTFNAHMAMGGSNNVSLSMPPPPVSANVVTTVQNCVFNSIPIYTPVTLHPARVVPAGSMPTMATSGAAGLQSAPVPSVGCASQPCAAAATASAAGPGQSLYQRMQQQSPHLGAAACGMSGQQLQQYAVKLHGVTAAIGRTGVATPATYLLQRCLHAFYVAANQKLSHPKFQPADGEELFALVRAAKTAFHQVPSSGAATAAGLFSDFLQHIRRQKACKKDIWNKVLAIANAQ